MSHSTSTATTRSLRSCTDTRCAGARVAWRRRGTCCWCGARTQQVPATDLIPIPAEYAAQMENLTPAQMLEVVRAADAAYYAKVQEIRARQLDGAR